MDSNDDFLKYGQPSNPNIQVAYVDSTRPVVGHKAVAQYHIILKRNDFLFKFLSILNTVISVIGVLTVVATFCLVCYGLITLSEVVQVVEAIKTQNS